MVADILTILFIAFSLSYLVAGVISILTIRKYKNISAELDTEIISYSIFQPSVSIIVDLDLRRADIINKIDNLLRLNYRNYDVIVVANSKVNPSEFERIITHFRLRQDPATGLYATKEDTYKRLIIADKPIRRHNRKLEYGMSVSKRKYIMPLYSIDATLDPDVLARPATILMSDPENRTYKLTGAYRYATEGDLMTKRFLCYTELNNLRKTYLCGNVCDRHNQHGLKMFSRVPVSDEVSQFIPEALMFVSKPDKMSSYLEVLASGMTDTKMCRIFYNVSQLFISAIFIFSVIMLLFTTGANRMEYACIAISVYVLVLMCNNFAIYILETSTSETLNVKRLRRLMLIAIPEALFSVSLTLFAAVRRMVLSKR